LVARVRAHLNRVKRDQRLADRIFDDHNLILNFDAHHAEISGRQLKLTPKEWRLLEYMIKHKNRTLSHATLLHQVWGENFQDANNILKVTISNLRHKLGDHRRHPRYIHTEHDFGYRFASRE
jgi:DNA-binding response OmpR family regulator